MTYSEILNSIKNKVFYPIYYLHGEEAFFIDQICNAIENSVLNESEKDFNQTTLYGRETDIPTIISIAKRFPMMANHQVLIIKEAQNLKNIDDLITYANNPQKSTIIVFCHKYGKLDGRKKISTILKKSHLIFESKKLYDNQISGWITDNIKQRGASITPKAAELIAEHLGTDLSRISNEIEKLFIGIEANAKINEQDVEYRIGISKDFNIFELQIALGNKDIYKANLIINYFASDPKNHPLTMIIPILYNYFTNLGMVHNIKDKSSQSIASALGINPFFVKDISNAARNYTYPKIIKIIGYLREYDAKSKGINNISSGNEDLMKEMIFKILH